MQSFEFEVSRNLGAGEGFIAGHLVITPESRQIGGAVLDCINRLETTDNPDQPFIPIVTDEYGLGDRLTQTVMTHGRQLAGIVTFGSDEDAFSTNRPQRTHLEVVAKELVKQRSDFIAVMLKVPDNKRNDRFKRETPLNDLHLRFGSILLKDDVLTISVDEDITTLIGTIDNNRLH